MIVYKYHDGPGQMFVDINQQRRGVCVRTSEQIPKQILHLLLKLPDNWSHYY